MRKRLSFNGCTIEYELTRKRVKNLNLRIRRDGSVHVSAPYLTPQSRIDSFILAHAGRILDSLRRIQENREQLEARQDRVTILGESLPLEFLPGRKNEANIVQGFVQLTLRDIDDDSARDAALQKLIRQIAVDEVTESSERIYPIFRSMGVAYPEIKFRKMKSRWGSCRYDKGSLSFNTALAHTPKECIDYVVMHEYCHFIHPDHSPAFHGLMTKLMPDWKRRKKVLEKYSSLL